MMRLRWLPLLFALAGLSLAFEYPQTAATRTPTPVPASLGAIEGMVSTSRYPVGTVPLAGWRVFLGRDCTLLAKTTTDSKGVYRFDGVAPGKYVVQLAYDQPQGEGWSASHDYPEPVAVAATETASGPDYDVFLFDSPRGVVAEVYNDLNENGIRDEGETGLCSIFAFSSPSSDVVGQVWTDLEGNYRAVGPAHEPVDGVQPPPPDPMPCSIGTLREPQGYRITSPRPDACGRNGCTQRLSEGVYQCQDFGLHLVDAQGARFRGGIWVDSAPASAGSVLEAYLGDTLCGEGFVWSEEQEARYDVVVRSQNARPGCGADGSGVRFRLDGRDISNGGTWKGGNQSLELFVGPSLSIFYGPIRMKLGTDRLRNDLPIQAYVGDVLCGETVAQTTFDYSYFLPVLSGELRPGCGREGDTVRFIVNGRQVPETPTWQAGRHYVWLTGEQLDVGLPVTGSLHPADAPPLVLPALSVGGLILLAVGLLLRRTALRGRSCP